MQPTHSQVYLPKLEFVEYRYTNSSLTTKKLIDKYFGHEYDYLDRVGAKQYFIALVDGVPKVIGRHIGPAYNNQ